MALPGNLSFSRQILPTVAIIGLIFAVVYIWNGLPDRDLSEPERDPPRATGDLANATRVAGSGVVEPSSEVIDIGTALAGLVIDLRVHPGDYVEQGQVLFTVDDRAVRARLQEAKAAIGEARAAIAEAKTAGGTAQRQLALYRNIDDAAAVSRSEVIRAEGEASTAASRLQVARSRLSSAQAAASSAQIELDRLSVRAPIRGEILAVNIHPGEYLSTMGGSAEPFIQMGETRPLYVRVDIDENEAVRLALGQPAIVSPRGGANYQVEADFVRAEPQVVPKRSLTNSFSERVDVRVLQVLYRLPDTNGVFRVGQQIDAYIPARNDGASQDTAAKDEGASQKGATNTGAANIGATNIAGEAQ